MYKNSHPSVMRKPPHEESLQALVQPVRQILRNARAHTTATALAEILGISKTTLIAIESGTVIPTTDTIAKILYCLDIKPEDLYKKKGDASILDPRTRLVNMYKELGNLIEVNFCKRK